MTFEDVSFRYHGTETFALTRHLAGRPTGRDRSRWSVPAEPARPRSATWPLASTIRRRGRILLDDRDLREIDVESYRRLIGVVEQDVFLFDGSVAANIGYGKRLASIDSIRRAAEIANAHEFIDQLPQGYDTLIGERGVKLSGGQRQRLAIARAVLADPRILILDEATSNLDTESERLIQASLVELMRNRTCFVIAHRLSTIAHADRIVVIEAGQHRGNRHARAPDGHRRPVPRDGAAANQPRPRGSLWTALRACNRCGAAVRPVNSNRVATDSFRLRPRQEHARRRSDATCRRLGEPCHYGERARQETPLGSE